MKINQDNFVHPYDHLDLWKHSFCSGKGILFPGPVKAKLQSERGMIWGELAVRTKGYAHCRVEHPWIWEFGKVVPFVFLGVTGNVTCLFLRKVKVLFSFSVPCFN